MAPTRRPGLVTRLVDGEVVILDRAAGNVHRLNATASFIWDQCDGKTTSDEIASRLSARFDRTPEQVRKDVLDAIADLERLGLLAP